MDVWKVYGSFLSLRSLGLWRDPLGRSDSNRYQLKKGASRMGHVKRLRECGQFIA